MSHWDIVQVATSEELQESVRRRKEPVHAPAGQIRPYRYAPTHNIYEQTRDEAFLVHNYGCEALK